MANRHDRRVANRHNRHQQHGNDTSRNPIERIDRIGKRIQHQAIGYQAALRKYLAELYGIAREIEEDFEQYQELISCPCFANRPRFKKATADNFDQYTIEAVLRRAFDGIDVADSCISKYIGAVKHCAAEGIRPAKAAAKMEEWGGVEKTYQRGQEPADTKTTSPSTGEETSKPKTSSKDQTVAEKTKIFHNDHLHVTVERKYLRSLLKGKKGERRIITIECNGRDEAGYLIWKLVENDSKPGPSGSDHDNDDGDLEDAT